MHKAIDREPVHRYATACDLADDLRRYLNDEPVLARPVSSVTRGWRWCKRNPAIATLIALTFLSLILGTIVSSFFAAVAQSRYVEQAAARESAEQQLYVNRIWLADRERSAGNLRRVNEILDFCDEKYRGWEWRLLKHRSQVEQRRIEQENCRVRELALSPDGRIVLAATAPGEVRLGQEDIDEVKVFSAVDGRQLQHWRLGVTVKSIDFRFGRDGRHAVGVSPKAIAVLRGLHDEDWIDYSCYSDIGSLSKDLSRLAIIATDNPKEVEIVDLMHGTTMVVDKYVNRYRAVDLAFAGDSSELLLTRDDSQNVHLEILRLADRQRLLSTRVRSLSLNSQHTLAGGITSGNEFVCWNTQTGARVSALPLHVSDSRWSTSATTAFAMNEDGTSVALGRLQGSDGAIMIWNVDAAKRREPLRLPGLPACEEGQVKDVRAGADTRIVRFGPDGPPSQFAFSRDGQMLAAPTVVYGTRVWNARDGKLLASVQQVTDQVSCVAIDTDDELLAIGSLGGDVRMWSLTGTSLGMVAKGPGRRNRPPGILA